jgi:hypothetical protein
MTRELDELLVSKYPKIFADRHGDMRATAMCWGFECNDGWFWLLDSLCSSIQGYIDNNGHLNIPQVVATQVKEKFGGLRFYHYGGDDIIHGMVWLAEHQSYNICENCGSTKDIGRTSGWVYVRCKECAEKEELLNWKLNSEINEGDED